MTTRRRRNMASKKAGTAGRDQDLGAIDRAILGELAHDPHASKAVIAERLAIPLELAAARLLALQARNAVRIRPVISVNKASRFFVYRKISINAADLDAQLRAISSMRQLVSVFAVFGGRFNALVYFTFGDMEELHSIVAEIMAKVEGIAEFETSIISDSLLFRPEYIDYPGSTFVPDVAANIAALELEGSKCGFDDLDIAIIAELQCDGRKSIRAISRKYEVNPGTIHYRLRQMEALDKIRYVSVIAHRELAYECFAVAEIRIEAGAAAQIVEQLADKPWLGHLLEVVGACDLIAFVNARDQAEAHAIISDHIRALPGVKAVDARMLMEAFKFDPRWGFSSSRS